MDIFLRSSSSPLIMSSSSSSSSSFIIRIFIICGTIFNLSHQIKTIDALQPMKSSSLFIVFGRPGSGKTTVANKAFESLSLDNNKNNQHQQCIELDLDVCISQEMKDNFGRGIYPSLKERNVFASGACDYVEKQLDEKLLKCQQQKQQQKDFNLSAIISFSFVNTDLRDIFRERFPKAEWILIDTTEEECTKRINEREGHFYKGDTPDKKKKEEEVDTTTNEEKDMSEWEFNPVTFPHIILDGNDPIDDNANNVVKEILGKIKAI